MDNSNFSDPVPVTPATQPTRDKTTLTSYYCPHCGRFLFKGNVQKLNMVCHFCQELICADADKLIKPE